MTGKITLIVAALLVALSGVAVAGTADVPRRHLAAVHARQALDRSAPVSVDAPNTHRYHGGPKSND